MERAELRVSDRAGRVLVTWATDDATPTMLTLANGPAGHVRFGPGEVTVAPGIHAYELEIQTSLYGRQTFLKGAFPVAP